MHLNKYRTLIFRSVRKIAKKRLSASHVCPSAWNSAPTGRTSMKFDIREFFRKSAEKIQVPLKSDKNNGHFTRRPTTNVSP